MAAASTPAGRAGCAGRSGTGNATDPGSAGCSTTGRRRAPCAEPGSHTCDVYAYDSSCPCSGIGDYAGYELAIHPGYAVYATYASYAIYAGYAAIADTSLSANAWDTGTIFFCNNANNAVPRCNTIWRSWRSW